MAAASSIFLLLGFVLSVVVAPQLRVWTWGAPMLFFAVATVLALPTIFKQRVTGGTGQNLITVAGLAVVLWIAIRAFLSPVAELAAQDYLLVAMAVAVWVSFQAVSRSVVGQRILLGGLAILTLATFYMMFRQESDPWFNPILGKARGTFTTGFHWHYSHCAAFLIGMVFLFAGFAFGSKSSLSFRVLMAMLAVAALGAIYFTKSRSGMVSMGGGLMAFIGAILLVGKRDKKKWFLLAVFILPFLLIGGAIGYISLVDTVFEERGTEGIAAFDNMIRLYMLSIAFSTFFLHPFIGGGARSYSWECYRFWDVDAMGAGSHSPTHVHNELVQTFTDYGLIGAGLLCIFLVCGLVVACVRLGTKKTEARSIYSDAWRIGGLAGFVGVFVGSNFEGILRNPPGAVLLAFCIAAMCFPLHVPAAPLAKIEGRRVFSGIASLATALIAVAAISILGLFGVKGTRVSLILWPTMNHPKTSSKQARTYALSDAIAVWPLASLYEARAYLHREQAGESTSETEARTYLDLAIYDFEKAHQLHPYDPSYMLGVATLLSDRGNEEDQGRSTKMFEAGIAAQGGMEAGFRGKYLYAVRLQRKGAWDYAEGKIEAAKDSFQLAARYMDESAEKDAGGGTLAHYQLRVQVHENYGMILAELGDTKGALAQFNIASKLPYGTSAHYLAAVLMAERAIVVWNKREGSDALRMFLDARQRFDQAQELPSDATPEKVAEWKAYIDQSMEYLRAANYDPSESVEY